VVTEADIDLLFTKPPHQFITARNELAKEAKGQGKHDLAIKIAALRKPTAVVWTVNQVARRHPQDIEILLQAANEVRELQRQAQRGVGPESLREASKAWHGAVAKLVKRGRDILESAGHREVAESRVTTTLLGASADETKAKLLLGGRLTDEVKPPGFEGLLGNLGTQAVERPVRRRSAPRPAQTIQLMSNTRRERTEGQERQREHEAKLRALSRQLTRSQKEAAKAEKAAVARESRAAEASGEGARARAGADTARKAAADLERQLETLKAEK